MQYEQIKVDHDIRYSELEGRPLEMDIFRPAANEVLPVIMAVHGGGWCEGTRQGVEDFAKRFASDGYVAVSVSYRLAPAFPFPAACEDMLTALGWLRDHIVSYGGDPTRIGAYGVSAGAHLVAWLATEPRVQLACAVAWAGPTDMRREPVTHPYRGYAMAFMGDCLHEAPQAYADASPLLRINPKMPPLLLIHGINDTVVPHEHAQWMAEAAAKIKAPIEALLLEEVGHTGGDPNDPRQESGIRAMNEFFSRHLR